MSQSAEEAIGTVVSLWRYPVKSMMGEELNSAEVSERGLLGDRAYALVDGSDGKVASAKNPRKWPQMFEYRASFVDPPRRGAEMPPVRVTLPDGTVVSSLQADVHESLSSVLGREVTLEAAERDQEELSRPVDRRVTRLADHLLIRRVARPACPSRSGLRRGPGRRGVARSRRASGLVRTR